MSAPDCAAAIVAQLCAQRVRDVVLSPGSRSAPLALALASAESQGMLRVHVRTDERSGGFLALGLAKASGVPSVVVTTSGTAVGNLLPAVMEAHHAGVCPGLVVGAGIVVDGAGGPGGAAGRRPGQSAPGAGAPQRRTRRAAGRCADRVPGGA